MSFIEFDTQKSNDQHMQEIIALAEQLALTNAGVLIFGETGTGKTSLAKYIHYKGRPNKNLEFLDCKTASLNKIADAFKNAQDGTLVLEDIDQSLPEIQAQLFVAIEGVKDLSSRPRIIATSKRELRSLARQELFRQDLYYKITVMSLHIPKLTDRMSDFESISRFILDVNQVLRSGKGRTELSLSALQKLQNWNWPGNIYELENVLERAAVMARNNVIDSAHIIFEQDQIEKNTSDLGPGMSLSEVEKRLILQTLELTSQNRTRAAQMLGISIRTLRNKLNEYREVGA